MVLQQYLSHHVLFCALVRYCGFFFQAEDGIRDLVRSRGLGDVYKRQHLHSSVSEQVAQRWLERGVPELIAARGQDVRPDAVSYTHLTLPTSDLV